MENVTNTLNLDANTTLDLIVEAAMADGLPSNARDYSFLQNNRKKNPMIMVASGSRTGSTFACNALRKIAGLNAFRYCQAHYGNEADLYLPALCIADRQPTISLQHIKATYPNCQLIKMFGIKTIVMIRNIFDTTISFARVIRRLENSPNFSSGYASGPYAWVDTNQLELTDQELIDMAIELYLPWYINFYVSWQSVSQRKEVPTHWLTFETLKADPNQAFKNMLEFCQLPAVRQDWDVVMEELPPEKEAWHSQADHKSHQDWASLMTEQQRNKIKHYATFYPKIDFSLVGL